MEHAAALLNEATKPVLVAGVKLRSFGGVEAFRALADASGYGVAVMPNAKGMYDEESEHFLGIYWGPVGSPGCAEIVESADLVLFAGATFTDYTTTGHAALANPARMIQVRPDGVVLPGQTFNEVALADFLRALRRDSSGTRRRSARIAASARTLCP